MNEELLGDARCVIRSFMYFKAAKTKEGKRVRLENFRRLAKEFENKWNPIMGKNMKFTDWVRYIGRSEESVHTRISR